MNSKENLYTTSKNHTHMNKVLLIKLRHKKEACKIWKQGQAIQEEYKDTIPHCRDGARKAKTHLDEFSVRCERQQDRPLQEKGRLGKTWT